MILAAELIEWDRLRSQVQEQEAALNTAREQLQSLEGRICVGIRQRHEACHRDSIDVRIGGRLFRVYASTLEVMAQAARLDPETLMID